MKGIQLEKFNGTSRALTALHSCIEAIEEKTAGQR